MQDDALYAAPTRADRSGRILAAVEVNGRGPFRFILDTGANSSALAPRVVEELGLPAAAGVQVHGVTGTALLPAVNVESMRAGEVILPPAVLPVLPGDIFGDADGILGVTGMQAMRIDVDFLHDRVTIARSRDRRATGGFVTVKASLWQGGLLLVEGRVGSIPAQVIIDTGAERTMGNVPLREAILARSKRGEEFATTVFGATPDVESGTYFRAPRIAIGSAHLVDLPVTFGDLHVFDLWGLTDEPALVIGMDVLGRLERFVVDYRRREFQIKPRGTGSASIRKCTPSTCGSRIPESGDD
jgi:predicted aspartyl protease